MSADANQEGRSERILAFRSFPRGYKCQVLSVTSLLGNPVGKN
jgi:hypothetical protein